MFDVRITKKSDNPFEGESYYDLSENQRYIYKSGNWYKVSFKLSKNLTRREKIKAIFK